MLIAQITDTHIVDKNQHWLCEPATEIHARLSRVIDYINHLDPAPDVVLLTGDVTDEGDPAAYQHFRELIKALKAPLYVTPGNHDRREEMRKAFSDLPYMPSSGFIHYAIEDYPVRLVSLDTHVEGEDYGMICEERFCWLEKTLKEEPEKPTLIFMHHPPIKTGTKLFDTMTCFSTRHFEKLIQESNQILGVVSGHYHHFCFSLFARKPCWIAPSVAPVHYFAHPHDEHVTALELEDPAVTLHHWTGGEALVSHVHRVKKEFRRIDWKTVKK